MRAFGIAASSLLALVICYALLWGSLALWFGLQIQDTAKYVLIAVFLIPGAATIRSIFGKRTLQGPIVFAVFFLALLAWWHTLRPSLDADWIPDVAHQTTGSIDGDILTLENVRAFERRSENDVQEIWEQRTYDLSTLETTDLFLSYWGDPKIAHFIISFGFSNGEYLAWSVEVRRIKGNEYSPVADFFKQHPLIILAAEEYDVVGLRSNIWKNDVHLFSLKLTEQTRRQMLEGYVKDANALAETPRWYNSIFTNCTTVVFRMLESLGVNIPFDYRIIVNGYIPELFYEWGVLNTEYTIDELRALGRINERALAVGAGPGFSEAIRQGVPGL